MRIKERKLDVLKATSPQGYYIHYKAGHIKTGFN